MEESAASMNAWRLASHGGPDQLNLARMPAPSPGANQILVRVACAGLNYSDVLMVRGAYQIRPPLPFTPGQEVAGFVAAVGPGCALSVSERVVSKVLWGGFAPLALADAAFAIRIPTDLDFDDALVLPVVAITAWIALHHRARLLPGETALIHAGAGALGLAAIRTAVAAGARVVATVGSEQKAAACVAAGASEVVRYGEGTAWEDAVMQVSRGRGVDVVLDSVGGAVTDGSLRCLAREGRLLIAGFSSGEIASIRGNRLLLRNVAALGVYWSHEADAELIARAVEAILDSRQQGRLVLGCGARYPYETLPTALDDLAGRRTIGKSVLRVAPGSPGSRLDEPAAP
ncbi:MAG: zinc-binding dehydrogenase [Lautropia sp.]